MKTKEKILSLLVALLMTAAAAMMVNKAIFGRDFTTGNSSEVAGAVGEAAADPALTVQPDGSVVIHTSAVPGTVNGYAGPVPVDIYLVDGKISEVRPLDNTETPGFFARASAVCDSWKGLTPEEAMAAEVDGISGATFSSTAIITNVKAGLAHYQGVVEQSAPKPVPWKIWVAFAVTLAACIVPLFVKNKIYHNVQLVANVVVLGFWCGQFLDYSLILKYFSYGFGLPAGLVAIAMLVAAFVYPLFGHSQHYCAHICPFGSVQQLMAEICGFKLHIPQKAVKALDVFRKVLWGALMLLLWTDCLTGWMDLELFGAFSFESASTGILIAAGIVLALSAVVTRPYCRFICPTGSLFKRAENIG